MSLFALLTTFWWRKCFGLIHILAWGVLLVVLPLSWAMAERAEQKERRYLMGPLSGFAPTYALEMARNGHANITLDTAPDDPVYLDLIEAQVAWLKANPRAASVYTFRKLKDRQYRLVEGEPIQFIVACETDYNRDGVIEGDTELRVPIGEVFEDTDVSMLNVFLGHPSFSEEPVEDRWGVWMSAYAPIFGPTGEVEAAVGVDFDANEWVASIHRARSTMLAYAGLIVLALTGGVTIASNQLTSQAAAREREVGELTRKAKEKFEALVNSIEGVVFERDPRTNSLTFVSEQAERILGRPAGDWMKEPGSWEANLHPDDRDETARRCRESGQTRSTYSIEYRMLRPGGEVVWIRETGSPVIDEQGDISATRGVLSDVSDQKKAAEELEQTHRKLVETSRQAGMAEVATGVLHNVGNVLNSVNVASTLIRQRLNGSRLGTLGQLASLLQSQGERLPDFFRGDERGRLVPDYLEKLSHHLRQEQTEVLAEVEKLVKNVEHIKTIVDLQQS
ncbi:MAG: PAS domain-containing protein, partial [Verrucomicrobiae bacterium]|nr:PAS domain-containing protein [Verrucomicrobiae bacterium]